MFKEVKSRRLALLVAVALGGGGYLSPAQNVLAADVTIDASHAPSDNVVQPDGSVIGTAAGYIGEESDAGNVTENTLTFKGRTQPYDKILYGGITFGTGKVSGNHVMISGGTTKSIYGGKARSGDVTGNTAVVENSKVDGDVHGGITFGTGNADGNTVHIKGTATELNSIYGGVARGTGSATGNKVYFNAGTVSFAEWMVGGYVGAGGNAEENTVEVNGGKTSMVYGGFSNHPDARGNILKNRVVVRGGIITEKVFGGVFSGARATGSVMHNTVTVMGGTLKKTVCGGSLEDGTSTGDVAQNEVTVAGGTLKSDVIGGYTRSRGNLTGNIVTITGGKIQGSVYAAMSQGTTSTIQNNVVNLGDGKNELAAGTEIAKYIFGAFKGNRDSYAGNTLNVKASARAKNIVNFNKVNFYFTDTLQPKLTLRDSMGTKFRSLSDITIYGTPTSPSGTLIENNTSGGIVVHDGVTSVTRTGVTVETTLSKSSDNRKINYARLIFKGARAAETDGSDAWGGRSVVGNTTTDNIVTVDSGTHTNVYGGWTSGTGSDGPVDKQKDSTQNKVTVSGSAAVSGTVYGGFTNVAGGKATGNEVTVEKNLDANIVGGSAIGEASSNTVTIHANTGAVTGGISTGAAASGNKVYLANVTVTSATGGDGVVTHNNEIHLNGNAHVTNALTGGSQPNSTGNTLYVKGMNNTAGSITNIQKMTFDATNAAQDSTLLNVTGATQTYVNWASLTATGMAAKPLTLLRNAHGINLSGYTGAAKSETTDTTETNVDVRKTGNKITEIIYEGYTFKGTTTATVDGSDVYGGRSKAGNSTCENTITVDSGTHTNAYGGWTTGAGSTAAAEKRGDSTGNKVTVRGTASISGTVYGGLTDVAGGKATNNEVTVEKSIAGAVLGGQSAGDATGNRVFINANSGAVTGGKAVGEASGNIVTVGSVTVSSITGGAGATTKDNTVNINGTTVTDKIVGGTQADGTGNVLNIRGENSAQSVEGFQKMNFNTNGVAAGGTMLNVTGTGETNVNWAELSATGTAVKPLTLLRNANGIHLAGYTGAVKSETTDTTEMNIDVKKSGNKITELIYEGYTFKGITGVTSDGTDAWAGRSNAGNTTQDNTLTLDDAGKIYRNAYGGRTSGTGTKAAADRQNDSRNNIVNYTAGTVTDNIYGGSAANGEASGNTVNLGAITTAANICGGYGMTTKDNIINLRGAKVTGTVMSGSAANGTGNTLAVYKPSEVYDFAGVQNLQFYADEMAANEATPMLKLGVATKDIRGLDIGVNRSGAAPKLRKGDKITLMKTAGGALTTDEVIENKTNGMQTRKAEGMQGSSYRYEFEITQTVTGELTATVTNAGFTEKAKSLVETRAGASAFLNDAADFTAGAGMDAAKKEARAAAQSGNVPYGLWAGVGGGSLRHETGSYVDLKGWNLGVGWARENTVKEGTLTFGPFIEYGRGNYDSYLDDGTHGSGKTSFVGAGVMAKIETDSHWVDGSLRVGRTKSDYTGLATYDTTSTYYGVQVGAGKDFHVNESDTVGAYVRYAYSHTAGTSATLSSGETYDFDAVNSHRLRLGTRYTHGMTALGQFYAGLAWEYEFDGDARATSQGDSAPSPSLKGSSALLELGYRFAPQGSRMSYDLNLNGWQGKRKGVTGGVSVKWAF